MRRALPVVLAGAVAGALAGLVVASLQDAVYRADGSIAIVRQGQPPGSDPALAAAAKAAAELFESRAVAESAVANLRLDETPAELLDRVDVRSEAGSSLVRLEVDAGDPEEARRTAQELSEVATVLFNDRFGPETVASIWEAPRPRREPVSPRPARYLGGGALAGAILASLGLGVARRRESPPAGRAAPARPLGPPWTIAALEDLIDRSSAAPARKAEWLRLVRAVAEFAGPGGEVPRRLDQLVERELRDLVTR